MICPICDQGFNLSTRKSIKCISCDQCACLSCYKKYLEPKPFPTCMFCQKIWNRIDSFDGDFPKNFINGKIRENYGKYLFEVFKNSIPEHGEDVKIMSSYLREVRAIEDSLTEAIDPPYRKILFNRLYELFGEYPIFRGNESRETITNGIKCPGDCVGIVDILDEDKGQCNVCEKNYCIRCEKILNPGHVCNPEDLETVNALKEGTRSCPRCKTRIFRTEGCAQMWCVRCHTAFDWRTGEIDRGMIHNPHYIEWVKGQKVGGLTFLAQAMPDFFELDIKRFSRQTQEYILDSFDKINELTRDSGRTLIREDEWDEPRTYRVNGRIVAIQKSEYAKYIELMARWVIGHHDESKTIKILLMRDKTVEKRAALRDLKEWLAQTAGPIFSSLHPDSDTHIETLADFSTLLDPVIESYNEKTAKLKRVFNSNQFVSYKK